MYQRMIRDYPCTAAGTDTRCKQKTEKMQIATDDSSSEGSGLPSPMELCAPGFDAPPWVLQSKPPLAPPKRTYSYNTYGGWP